MGKNKFLHIKHTDRGYFRKAMIISMVISLVLLALSFISIKYKLLYFALILAAVFAFKQGRDFTNKYKNFVYISMDNFNIDIDNKFSFLIGQKRNVRLAYREIMEVFINNRIVEIITEKKKYKIYLNSISAEDERNLIYRLEKRVKVTNHELELE